MSFRSSLRQTLRPGEPALACPLPLRLFLSPPGVSQGLAPLPRGGPLWKGPEELQPAPFPRPLSKAHSSRRRNLWAQVVSCCPASLCSFPGGPGPSVLGPGDACSSLRGVHPVGKLPGLLAPGQGLGRHLFLSQGRGKPAVQADGPPSPLILLFLLPGWGAGAGRGKSGS